ncbi:MAG: ATP-binding cassette domain-containing protein [Chitinophagaceae bacterium]|uniref:peptidase domain-containing ABC transporter n=1 Tax=unclassified Paraflavitalea TaxID=2798305 RepID=UPI003D339772|nr:ATP-binding cassette domain-containing protein [Chitinophagaceae bacterium]
MKINALRRILSIITYEKREISAIYFYAVFSGLVQLALPLGIQSIISFVLGGAISTSLVLLIVFVVTSVFLNGLLQVNQMKIIEKIQQQLFVRYSFLYSHTIPTINLKGAQKYFLPELVNRFFDTISLQKGLAKLLLDIPAASIQILFGLILLSFYHPVFIIFGLTLLTILYLLLRYSGNRGLETSIEESDYKYKVAGWLEELARVVTLFKFSGSKTMHIKKTDEGVSGYLEARTNHFKVLLFQYWSLIGFKIIITASMLIVGSFLLIDQQLNIGQFIAAEIVILSLMGSVEKLIGNLDQVYDVLTSVEKLEKLSDLQKESTGAKDLEVRSQGIALKTEELSFSYDEKQPILNEVSLSVQPGEKVSIYGKLGAGTSTLLKVLTGAYQPYEGKIWVDQIPLSQINLASYRFQTGIQFNYDELFNGTIRENLTMGHEDIHDDDIYDLLKMVGLEKFVRSLPMQLEYSLTTGAKHLSKKTMQKLVLVRALIHKPRLLLMDDPWNGLNDEEVRPIQEYILKSMPNTTAIIVTNDEWFQSQCNQIIKL